MKKRRLLIALAVVLGAGACVLPWWEDVWLAVAYEEHGVHGKEFRCYRKRHSWLPGRDILLEDHVCWVCTLMPHQPMTRVSKLKNRFTTNLSCAQLETTIFVLEGGPRVTFDPGSWTCICPTCQQDRQ